MPFYAHTKNRDDGTPAPVEEWEPLFTPWHDRPGHDFPSDPSLACSGQNGAPCPHCESLHSSTIHNLVAPAFRIPYHRPFYVGACFGIPEIFRVSYQNDQPT